MPAPDKYVQFCLELLTPLGHISSKYMFGGWCLYCDGTPFAIVADGALFLKGGSNNIPDFEARGMKPFKPFPDQDLTMKYFETPPEFFEDADLRTQLSRGSIEAGRAKAKKKKKR